MRTRNNKEEMETKKEPFKGFRVWLEIQGNKENISNKIDSILEVRKKPPYSNYPTLVKRIQDKLKLSLDENIFDNSPEYLDDIINKWNKVSVDSRDSKNYKTDSISALFKYYDYVLSRHGKRNPRKLKPKQKNSWTLYNESLKTLTKDLDLSRNILGDFAEIIVCIGKGLTKYKNSKKSIDAIGRDKSTYQIKARVIKDEKHNTIPLGVCRTLDFDFLITVLFFQNGNLYAVLMHKKEYLEKEKNNAWDKWQKGYVFITTQEFLEAGENITTAILKENSFLFEKNKTRLTPFCERLRL